MRTMTFAVAALLAALAGPSSAQPGQAEDRSRSASARLRPFAPIRSIRCAACTALLLQNVAAFNRTRRPIELQSIEIALLQRRRGPGHAADRRRLAAIRPCRGGQSAAGAGRHPPARLSILRRPPARRLGPVAQRAASRRARRLLTMQQVFAYRGNRDELRVTVTGRHRGRRDVARRREHPDRPRDLDDPFPLAAAARPLAGRRRGELPHHASLGHSRGVRARHLRGRRRTAAPIAATAMAIAISSPMMPKWSRRRPGRWSGRLPAPARRRRCCAARARSSALIMAASRNGRPSISPPASLG